MTAHPTRMVADAISVRAAREAYFAANGFSEASYHDRWVKLKLGPLPVAFPNSPSRQRAIPLHDLHHVATGYATTWTGEAEIAAWEIGGSCTDHWAAWVLNAGGMGIGLLLAPRRVYRAFVAGRRSRNLYRQGWSDGLLDLSVDQLRRRLGVEPSPTQATWRDRLAFAAWVTLLTSPTVAALIVIALAL